MLQSLKAARRRSVETVLETVGVSEKVVDEEFELNHAKFLDMMEDLNECGASVSALLTSQKTYFGETVKMAQCLARIYKKNSDPTHWPGSSNMLSLEETSVAYENALQEVFSNYRSSSTRSCVDLSLTPMRSAVTAMGPEVDAIIKERSQVLIDCNSYSRRLKVLRSKYESAKGKPNESDVEAEVKKYEGKESKTKESYENLNNKCKQEIFAAKKAHDNLVDMQLITVLVTQARLFSMASRQIEGLLATLPQDKVAQVQSHMDQYIKQGGFTVKQQEKNALETGIDVALGKAYFTDLKSPTAEEEAETERKKKEDLARATAIAEQEQAQREGRPPPPPPPSSGPSNPPPPIPQSSTPISKSPTSGSTPAAPPPPPPPPPLPPASKKQYVIAVYDHEIEDDDELPFKVGDRIMVLDSSDEGWWKGQHAVTGEIGIFPVNYVKSE
mmetsp:Transcript_15377/g.23165  ORF Transcript_15377/g.23165 Transcript_15377/m.23165 type:complete len:443 (-) Transcript_15377:127-1455(-)